MDDFMIDPLFATPGAVLDTTSLGWGAAYTYQHSLETIYETTQAPLLDAYGCHLDASKDYLLDYMPPPIDNPMDTRTEAQKQDSRELEAMVAWMNAREAREKAARQSRG